METQTLSPHHTLLGTRPEPIRTARVKVIIGLIFIPMCTVLMIYQDVDPLRNRIDTAKTKVVSKIRHSGRKALDLLSI